MNTLPFPAHAIVSSVRDLPSIFEDGDNVYDTFALPSEDPRKAKHYVSTGAATPKARMKRAA